MKKISKRKKNILVRSEKFWLNLMLHDKGERKANHSKILFVDIISWKSVEYFVDLIIFACVKMGRFNNQMRVSRFDNRNMLFAVW